MPLHCCICPLWWGYGFFAPAGEVYAWQLLLSVARRDPSHGEWCPLLRLSLPGPFSVSVRLVLSGAGLLCVLGHSDALMQWGEVLRFLLLPLGNRCHVLDNRMPMKWLHPECQASSFCRALFLAAPSDPFSLSSVNVRWVIILAHQWDLDGWNHDLLFLEASNLNLRNVIMSRITSEGFFFF